MIVDIVQSAGCVDISYVNENGEIDILRKTNVKAWKYKETPVGDTPIWDGSGMAQKEPAERFGMYELRQYLYTLPKEEQELIFRYALPKVFACDIELDMSKNNAMKRDLEEITETADIPVNLLTVTTEELETYALVLEDDIRSQEKEGEIRHRVEEKIKNHLFNEDGTVKGNKHLAQVLDGLGVTKEEPLRIKVLWYKDERALLERFFQAQNNSFHTTIWWNNETFDSRYLHNRALVIDWEQDFTKNKNSLAWKLHPKNQERSLNKDGRINRLPKRPHLRSLASPEKTCSRKSSILTDAMVAKFGGNKPSTYKPTHRLELDYMAITDKFARKRDSKSLKLDVIAKEFLGIGKVSYEGNFRDLVEGDTDRFLYYGCIDTITLMLIHLSKKFLNQLLISAYTSKVPAEHAFYTTKKSTAVFHDYFWLEKNKVTISGYKKRDDDILLSDEMDMDDDSGLEEKPKSKLTIKVGYEYVENILQLDGTIKRSYRKHTQAPPKKDKAYEGGYVVPPRVEKTHYSAFEDAKSLYPSSGQSLGCSKEIWLGQAKTKEELKAAINAGHRVSFNGNIYDGKEDGALRVIWNRLIDGRYHAKDLALNLENFYIFGLEQAIKELEEEQKNV